MGCLPELLCCPPLCHSEPPFSVEHARIEKLCQVQGWLGPTRALARVSLVQAIIFAPRAGSGLEFLISLRTPGRGRPKILKSPCLLDLLFASILPSIFRPAWIGPMSVADYQSSPSTKSTPAACTCWRGRVRGNRKLPACGRSIPDLSRRRCRRPRRS